jgi:STE24 endopeptidase
MNFASLIIPVVLGLIACKWLAQLGLSRLNQRHVQAHAATVPAAFAHVVSPETYGQSVTYTLAKSRLNQWELTYDALVLGVVLLSGVLPWAYGQVIHALGRSAWAQALFLFLVGVGLTLLSLPFDWHAQFHLEERFGFNTNTPRTWLLDRLKGLLLALLIGYPVLVLLLKIIEWTGRAWWAWGWAALIAVQLILAVLAPVLIMPLFNKFTPLPEGSLRDRLQALARRTGFLARSIQVMDGSKRSRHSNAFFTGFGRFRKIVLFDTLVQQLAEPELEAVLAHEIGHYQRKHIHKMLAGSAALSLAGFYLLSLLARQPWFLAPFGFAPGAMAPALLLFVLLSGTVGFWLSPLGNYWSRRFEYQADAFSANAMGEPAPLIGALRKLNAKNLSNLTPHPLYSGFYYSHPTLLEREAALQRC